MKKIVFLLLVTLCAMSSWSQPPTITWQNTYSGIDYVNSIEKTPEGGNIPAKYSDSRDGEVTCNKSDHEIRAEKLGEAVSEPCPTLVLPTIRADRDTTFCQGGQVFLSTFQQRAARYQWLKDGVPIPGATDTLFIAQTGGLYAVRVLDTCGYTSATSRSLTVTVHTPPVQPQIIAGGPLSFCYGDSVVLTSSAISGNQWYAGDYPFYGATGKTFTAYWSGVYRVRVSNSCGTATSASVTITVANSPLKVPAPFLYASGDTTICSGKSVTLNAGAMSGVNYQWFHNGFRIAGATDSSYQAWEGGLYSVRVFSTCSGDSATSRNIQVTVNTLPARPTISASGPLSFCSGDSVVLTSSAVSGNRWYKDNLLISGATGRTYVVRSGGSYRVLVSNDCSIAGSDSLRITVSAGLVKPEIPFIYSVGDTTFCQGSSVLLKVAGRTGVSYKWFRNGSVIPGAIDTAYRTWDSGRYAVKAYSLCSGDSAASRSIHISVLAYPDSLHVTASGPLSFCIGGSVTLTASAAANYHWYKDGQSIAGARGRSYTATTTGSYRVYTTNACGTNASVPIPVKVSNTPPPPTTPAILNRGDTIFCQGRSVRLFTWSHTGVRYQWFKNGIAIRGAIDTVYTAAASGTYSVRVYNTCNLDSATSRGMKVTVLTYPDTPVVTASGPLSFCNGGSVTLTASPAANYQWYNDTARIAGATGQRYTATSSGHYRVYTSNSCGGNASVAVTVTVSATPATFTAPIFASGDTTFCQGGSVRLYTGQQRGLAYQWFRDGSVIAGATDTAYTAANSGLYTVKVYNMCSRDSTESKAIHITVLAYPDTPRITTNGSLSFCTGGSVRLSAPAAEGYQWYRDNVPLAGGTQQHWVATTSGRYHVSTQYACAAVTAPSVTVTVKEMPPTPVISATGNTLHSSAGTGNQWYLDGLAIEGATGQQYTARTSGTYTVRVTQNDCSTLSGAFPFMVTVPATVSCPANVATATRAKECAAIVNNLEPGIVPANSNSVVNYTLSGATTGSGTGSVSGKSFNKGVTLVTYTLANDTAVQCRFTVTVRDLEAPVIDVVRASPEKLWPPDHKMVDVMVSYGSTDNCGATSCKVFVSSNEPQNGLGDGDVDHDWEVIDNHHIRLRAERSGNGEGRIYTITVACTDASGNTLTNSTTVTVPKGMFETKAGPNPSTTQFTIFTKSVDNQPLFVRVLDVNGNLIEVKKNVAANSTLVLGRNYEPGTYYIELIQGSSKEVVRVIKLAR